jgi:hypothetical protein
MRDGRPKSYLSSFCVRLDNFAIRIGEFDPATLEVAPGIRGLLLVGGAEVQSVPGRRVLRPERNARQTLPELIPAEPKYEVNTRAAYSLSW